jgi:hypothetical protein
MLMCGEERWMFRSVRELDNKSEIIEMKKQLLQKLKL